MLCVFCADKEATGSDLPKASLYSITTYILLYQIITCLIFTINDDSGIQGVGGAFIIISIIIDLILLFRLEWIMKKARIFFRRMVKEEEENRSENDNENTADGDVLYIHPVEKKFQNSGKSNLG